jgi:hypothetical protein
MKDTPFHHGSEINSDVESNRFPNGCIFVEIGTGFRHQLEFRYRDFKQPIRTVYFVSFSAKQNIVPLVHDYFGVSKILYSC